MPELADDPRFATNGDRVEHRAELRPILAERLAERSTADWVAVLDAAEVPTGAVADVAAAFDSPEAEALGDDRRGRAPGARRASPGRDPAEFEATPGAIRTAPPLLGEHTDEVLTEARALRRERTGGSRGATASSEGVQTCTDRVVGVPAAARLAPALTTTHRRPPDHDR